MKLNGYVIIWWSSIIKTLGFLKIHIDISISNVFAFGL